MAKFDIKNSMYAQFYSDATMLRTYVNEDALLRTNFGFWRSQFEINPETTPTDEKGVAAYHVEEVIETIAPMAEVRAPLGRSKAIDREGTAWRTGTIPDLISFGYYENAFERSYENDILDQYGRDKALIMQWTKQVQKQVDSLNQALSNMSAQLLSTGKIDYTNGRGLKYYHDMQLPKENIQKAGTGTWATKSTKILDQMAKIENDFRMKTGFEGAMKWQIPYDMWMNTFLTNEQVIEWVKFSKALVGITVPETSIVTPDEAQIAIAKYGKISPIEVIVEKQNNFSTMVSGWKSNMAVLRPAGYAGYIMHTDILDKKMHDRAGAKSVSKVFAPVGEGGLFTLININRDNGDYQEWSTETVVSAAPTLTEFTKHILVKTDEAGEGTTTLDD